MSERHEGQKDPLHQKPAVGPGLPPEKGRGGMSLLPLQAALDTILPGLPVIVERESVGVTESLGRVLAEDLGAISPYPAFDQSAMDGYALRGDGPGSGPIPVVGRIAAGGRPQAFAEPGAVRIFTGAPMPPEFDRVVMQEDCRTQSDQVEILNWPAAGEHLRRAGEDMAAGAVVLAAGSLLGPREIAVAAAVGHENLPVLRAPRVGVLSTGDELAPPGAMLAPGQIHDSNRPMLLARLAAMAVPGRDLGQVPDRAEVMADRLAQAAANHDLLLTSGGVSVGEEDRLAEAIAAAGGTVRLYRLAIRPGKPLALGRIGPCTILGLPGNAFSSFMSFNLVGRPVLARIMGTSAPELPRFVASLAFRRPGKLPRSDYVPVRVIGSDEAGRPLLDRAGPPGSARLSPILLADGVAEIPTTDEPVHFIPMAGLVGF